MKTHENIYNPNLPRLEDLTEHATLTAREVHARQDPYRMEPFCWAKDEIMYTVHYPIPVPEAFGESN